ncbi:hypothetical protein E4T56_gene755 [Termitomyces sp. T112]|nr:hypothetical protein E4T56_gene755 [Termitomyces sp. T112]
MFSVATFLVLTSLLSNAIAHPIPQFPATNALVPRAKLGSADTARPVASGSRPTDRKASTSKSSGSEYEEPLRPGSLGLPRPVAPPREAKTKAKIKLEMSKESSPSESGPSTPGSGPYPPESGSEPASSPGASRPASPVPPQRLASPGPAVSATPPADGPGSYAVMSPRRRFLIYDSKYDAYVLYFKFGDTNKSDRDHAYSTHDPSVLFKSRKDQVEGQGKEMEKETLKALVTELQGSGIIQHVGTTTKNSKKNSESYEIYLGQDKIKALERKAMFDKLLKRYGDETKAPWTHGGWSHDKFVEEFLALFHAQPGQSTPFIDRNVKPTTEMPRWREYSNIRPEED